MSGAPLLTRIAAAAQRAHDDFLELLELSDEMRDVATRGLGITERFQKTVKSGIDAPGVLKLPRGVVPDYRSQPAWVDDRPPADGEPASEVG